MHCRLNSSKPQVPLLQKRQPYDEAKKQSNTLSSFLLNLPTTANTPDPPTNLPDPSPGSIHPPLRTGLPLIFPALSNPLSPPPLPLPIFPGVFGLAIRFSTSLSPVAPTPPAQLAPGEATHPPAVAVAVADDEDIIVLELDVKEVVVVVVVVVQLKALLFSLLIAAAVVFIPAVVVTTPGDLPTRLANKRR